MNTPTVIPDEVASLPTLVDRASSALAGARNAAEVLEARDMADFAYDVAKRAARLQKAKGAHDELIAAAHRAQAGALEIEAQAKRRLADEYDAAQQRGELKKAGNPNSSRTEELPGAGNIGFNHKLIHEARQIRDAEEAEPGIVRRVLDEHLERGDEPTKAGIRKALSDIKSAVRRAARDAALGGEKLPSPARARELSRKAGGAGVIGSDGKYHFHTTPEQDAARAHWHALRYGVLDDLETETTPEQAVAAVPPHMRDWVAVRAAERLNWLQSFLDIWRRRNEH